MQIAEQLLLGLALASAAGLRAFVPLLVLAIASRYGVMGVHLNGQFAWLHSTAAIITLTVATVAEVLADKVPGVDHALDALQTVVRPAAGALAFASTQAHVSPVTAGILGLILGAPLAGGLHLAKGGARIASTASTAGLGNPILSTLEDIITLLVSILSLFAPLLGLALIVAVVYFVWRAYRNWLKPAIKIKKTRNLTR